MIIKLYNKEKNTEGIMFFNVCYYLLDKKALVFEYSYDSKVCECFTFDIGDVYECKRLYDEVYENSKVDLTKYNYEVIYI